MAEGLQIELNLEKTRIKKNYVKIAVSKVLGYLNPWYLIKRIRIKIVLLAIIATSAYYAHLDYTVYNQSQEFRSKGNSVEKSNARSMKKLKRKVGKNTIGSLFNQHVMTKNGVIPNYYYLTKIDMPDLWLLTVSIKSFPDIIELVGESSDPGEIQKFYAKLKSNEPFKKSFLRIQEFSGEELLDKKAQTERKKLRAQGVEDFKIKLAKSYRFIITNNIPEWYNQKSRKKILSRVKKDLEKETEVNREQTKKILDAHRMQKGGALQ